MSIFSRTRNNAIALIGSTAAFFSCTKTDTTNTSPYIGQWHGTECGKTANHTITAGPNGLSIYITDTVGFSDTCKLAVKMLGTISGNLASDNFSGGLQSFMDNCGRTTTVNCGGYINNDTLVLTIVHSSDTRSSVCQFKGIK
jgi:hypothetical protein